MVRPLGENIRNAARQESRGRRIVSVIPDFGERYLSNPAYTELAAAEPPPEITDLLG